MVRISCHGQRELHTAASGLAFNAEMRSPGPVHGVSQLTSETSVEVLK